MTFQNLQYVSSSNASVMNKKYKKYFRKSSKNILESHLNSLGAQQQGQIKLRWPSNCTTKIRIDAETNRNNNWYGLKINPTLFNGVGGSEALL